MSWPTGRTSPLLPRLRPAAVLVPELGSSVTHMDTMAALCSPLSIVLLWTRRHNEALIHRGQGDQPARSQVLFFQARFWAEPMRRVSSNLLFSTGFVQSSIRFLEWWLSCGRFRTDHCITVCAMNVRSRAAHSLIHEWVPACCLWNLYVLVLEDLFHKMSFVLILSNLLIMGGSPEATGTWVWCCDSLDNCLDYKNSVISSVRLNHNSMRYFFKVKQCIWANFLYIFNYIFVSFCIA